MGQEKGICASRRAPQQGFFSLATPAILGNISPDKTQEVNIFPSFLCNGAR